MSPKSETIYEYDKKTYSELGISDSHKRILRRLNRDQTKRSKTNRRPVKADEESGYFKLWDGYLKATKYVGVVKLKNKTITVLPKIFGENEKENTKVLLYMLGYTGFFKRIKEIPSGLFSQERGFFDVITYLYAKNLLEELKRGMSSEYITVEENTPYLRGKLLIHKHITKNVVNKARFYCEHDEYFIDNTLNQTLKFASSLLKVHTGNNLNKRMLSSITNALELVDNCCPTKSSIEKVKFTRENVRFKPHFDFAKMIIDKSMYSFSGSRIEYFSFMFNMYQLFEDFISRIIQWNPGDIFISGSPKVFFQGKIKENERRVRDKYLYLFKNDIKKLKPDIVVKSDDIVWIIDTKYKKIQKEDKEDDLRDMTSSDAYQMYTYGKRYKEYFEEDSKNDDSKKIKTLLLYPQHLLEGGKEKKYEFVEESDIPLKVAAIDLQARESNDGSNDNDKKFPKRSDYITNIKEQLNRIFKEDDNTISKANNSTDTTFSANPV